MHTLKPLDKEAVLDCVRDIGRIITVEDPQHPERAGSACARSRPKLGGAKVNEWEFKTNSECRLLMKDCWKSTELL